MASFDEALPRNPDARANIFKPNRAQCHTIEKCVDHKQGPNLNRLFGRCSGTAAGYSYLEANKSTAIIWEVKTLYDYLLNLKKVREISNEFSFTINPWTAEAVQAIQDRFGSRLQFRK